MCNMFQPPCDKAVYLGTFYHDFSPSTMGWRAFNCLAENYLCFARDYGSFAIDECHPINKLKPGKNSTAYGKAVKALLSLTSTKFKKNLVISIKAK